VYFEKRFRYKKNMKFAFKPVYAKQLLVCWCCLLYTGIGI